MSALHGEESLSGCKRSSGRHLGFVHDMQDLLANTTKE